LESSSYVSTDVNAPVKLRLEAAAAAANDDEVQQNNAASYEAVSIPSLLKKAATECPNQPALSVKRNDEWVTWSYADYLKDVESIASAFIKLGLEERSSVAIMGFNSPEWFISYMAAITANGIGVGIYPTNSPESTKYIASHCKANILVVEDDLQLQKILKIRDELPALKAIVQYTGIPVAEGVLSWAALLKMGQDSEAEVKGQMAERLSRMAINACAGLVYTSGTTGAPKGVMLSHDNLSWTAKVIGEAYKAQMEKERVVSYLPLSHIAATLLDMMVMLVYRGHTYFADKNALKGSLNYTLKEAMPTIFLGVPRVWEKFQEKMTEIGQSNKGLRRQIGNWAKRTGLKHNKHLLDGPGAGATGQAADTLSYRLANQLVFQKVKAALGLNKCRVFLSGAAPFALSTFQYFLSLDIRIMELYGMSESTGPHTLNTTEFQQAGSIGKTMAGCHTKIDTPESSDGSNGNGGEICMRGRHVMMGYLNDTEKTSECLTDGEEGFLRSGDVGVVAEDGFLTITGRIKEILITAGGENVPPVPIEANIKDELPCISNAIVIGDKRKFLSCLLTVKTEVDPETQTPTNKLTMGTLKWLAEHEITEQNTVEELYDGSDYPTFAKAIQAGVERANKKAVSNAQKVQKWAFVRKDFSLAGGELGPTLKAKRHVIIKNNEALINHFYK